MPLLPGSAVPHAGEPSPLGRLIGLSVPPLATLATDPSLLQVRVLEAARNLLSRAGLPAQFTSHGSGVLRDRMMLEFLTRSGQLGRLVASMVNPREYLMLLEELNPNNRPEQLQTAKTAFMRGTPINPVHLLQRVYPTLQQTPEGVNPALLGAGSGAQAMAAIRAIIAQAPGLIPLLLSPQLMQQLLPSPLQVRG